MGLTCTVGAPEAGTEGGRRAREAVVAEILPDVRKRTLSETGEARQARRVGTREHTATKLLKTTLNKSLEETGADTPLAGE